MYIYTYIYTYIYDIYIWHIWYMSMYDIYIDIYIWYYIIYIYTHILGSVPVLRRTARAACGKPRESGGPWGCSSMIYHGNFPPSCEMTAGYPFLEDVVWDTWAWLYFDAIFSLWCTVHMLSPTYCKYLLVFNLASCHDWRMLQHHQPGGITQFLDIITLQYNDNNDTPPRHHLTSGLLKRVYPNNLKTNSSYVHQTNHFDKSLIFWQS